MRRGWSCGRGSSGLPKRTGLQQWQWTQKGMSTSLGIPSAPCRIRSVPGPTLSCGSMALAAKRCGRGSSGPLRTTMRWAWRWTEKGKCMWLGGPAVFCLTKSARTGALPFSASMLLEGRSCGSVSSATQVDMMAPVVWRWMRVGRLRSRLHRQQPRGPVPSPREGLPSQVRLRGTGAMESAFRRIIQ